MAEVAQLAGVATSTVSRALTNPEKVSKKTVAKVQAAATKLGYTPNMVARNFRKGTSSTILIVLPEFLQAGISQVIPQLLENINRCLVDAGYNLMIANLGSSDFSQKHILDLAFGGSVRGTIMLSPVIPEEGGRSLLQTNLPVVSTLFDLSESGIPSVISDERDIMKRVTLDFFQRGFRRFFYISGPEGSYQEAQRFVGVQDAIAELGLPNDALMKFGGHLGFQEGFTVGKEAGEFFLSNVKNDEKVLVISSSDDMSLSFMSTIQNAGVSIPENAALVSFDNSPACEWLRPSLSSIAFPYVGIAESAVSTLLKKLENRQAEVPVKTVLANTFYERNSSL